MSDESTHEAAAASDTKPKREEQRPAQVRDSGPGDRPGAVPEGAPKQVQPDGR